MKSSQLRVSESPSLALVAEAAISGNESQKDVLLDSLELPVNPAYGLCRTVGQGGGRCPGFVRILESMPSMEQFKISGRNHSPAC